jgi:type I protein arginine methyltransferase
MKKILSYLIKGLYSLALKVKNIPAVKATLYAAHNKSLFSKVDQHERMLADSVRVDNYHAAIHKYVREGDTVVDLGSGTGILSFFASQKNPKHIYAIDHGAIIEMAKFLAKKNDVHNISFVQMHSSKFTPAELVDVIIHEQIGDFLVDEDMVRNLCDLRDRILKPGGKILPNEFDLFMEPAQIENGMRTPFLWEQQLHGIRFDGTKEWLNSEQNTIERAHPHYRLLPNQVSHFLCKPEPIFMFDIMSADPNNMPTTFTAHKKVTHPGIMDGFCLYFNIRFDEEIAIPTSPIAKATHWANQLFRTDPIECQAGDVIELEFEMPSYTSVATWKVKHSIKKRVPENTAVRAV